MRVYAIREPARRTILVYVELGAEGDGSRYFESIAAGNRETVKVAPGEEPPMWLRVPEEIAAAVAEALAPRPAATERHLDDAIEVRDPAADPGRARRGLVTRRAIVDVSWLGAAGVLWRTSPD